MTVTIDSSRVSDMLSIDLDGIAKIALDAFWIDEHQVLLEDIKGQIKHQIKEKENVQKTLGKD